MRAILGVLVSAILVAGCGGAAASKAPAGPSAAPQQASPSASAAIGGTVRYKTEDGSAASTAVDLVADGTTVSGTAVSESSHGVHSVQLGCATRTGDTWALGGTVDKTTLAGESAGAWSAVIIKDGSPQRIAIWLSEAASAAPDCKAWLAKTDFAGIGDENFTAVESGTLVPPPGLAP